MNRPDLLDAAGNKVPVDTCACGRPKIAGRDYCCLGCPSNRAAPFGNHASGCNIRCATLGVPGFGVTAVAVERLELREIPRLTSIQRAERKGRLAAKDGFSTAANPYTKRGFGRRYHEAWNHGYEQGSIGR